MNPNKSISYQPLPNQRKSMPIKEHLSVLATKIKVRMDENQILMDTINNVCINIKKSRQQLKKFSSNQTKDFATLELNKNISNLKISNKNLLIQKKSLFHTYIKLKNKYFIELEPVSTELKLLNDRKFIMENIIKKRDFEIERNELNLEVLYTPFAREEQREIFGNNLEMDEDDIINDLEKNQSILLNKLKDFNKYNNRVKELNKEKEILSKILNKLKGRKKKLNEFSLEEQNVLYKKINPKRNNYLLQYNEGMNSSLLNTIDCNNSILSDIMNETINSEYDEEENIEFISSQKNYKPLILSQNLRNKIPKINLEQIEFNKMKFKQEDAEKSLSRELKNFDEYDMKKEIIKSMIKKEKAKNKRLVNKILDINQKINMMEKIITNLKIHNYKLSTSAFRDKKGGNNLARQFSALSGRQREIINLKLKYGEELDFNKDKNSRDKSEIINHKDLNS